MSVRTKLVGFCALLVVALGGGAAVGAGVGPIDIGGDAGHVDVDRPKPSGEPSVHQGH